MAILSFTDARRVVEQFAASSVATLTEHVALGQARNRVLAKSINADRDLPPFPRSARDGYAVRSADLVYAPVKLRVIGEIRAGVDPHYVCSNLHSGDVVAIMTGAALPAGADAVVMIEHTLRPDESFVEVLPSAFSGENVVPAGLEASSGSTLLSRGTRLDFSSIATAASVGATEVEVFARPQVAILSTGDEVVPAEYKPGPYQIRNSNAYSLAAQVSSVGGEPIVLPIAPDEPRQLAKLVAEGLRHDLLLITGGVSAGKYDLVEAGSRGIRREISFHGREYPAGKTDCFRRGHDW